MIPLLSLAIGAFFLDWQVNLALAGALLVFIALHGAKKIKKAAGNLLALFVFTLPILVMKILTVREGMLLKLGAIEVYSLALAQGLNLLLRVLVFAMASFIALEIWFPVGKWKKVREKYRFLDILFASVELYQNMLLDFVAYFRKKGKKHGLADFLDNAYSREWDRMKEKK